jgi:hypothetical protein
MLNEAARAELERNIDKEQKELQRSQQDAQEEVQQLQQDLQNGFQAKLLPIIQQVVNERKITILFSSADAGIVFADPGWTSRPTSSSGSTRRRARGCRPGRASDGARGAARARAADRAGHAAKPKQE